MDELNTLSRAMLDARHYETNQSAFIMPEDRPAFHLSPRVGWMNDPNGFSFYNGQYHLFYQYHPYDSHWGPMHWGHAVSSDLLHWEYLPAALAPDMPYDYGGCFSGTALTLPDGRHALMYTGVADKITRHGGRQQVQTQNLAFGDGLNYAKFPGNPVITAEDLPAGASDEHFRDPKLWQEPDGRYRCVIASRDNEGGGQVLLYESEDLVSWRLIRKAAENHNRLGLMWECPDLFRLDGQDVLLVSAQDMLPQGFEYHNGDGVFCLIGTFDPESGEFRERANQAVDYGIDFYAPQTILTPDGRRVMVGWLMNWDTCNQHYRNYPWFGQMSLPRELFFRDGVLCQRPIRELEQLRADRVCCENVEIRGEKVSLPGVDGRQLDLELEVFPLDGPYQRFSVWFAQDEQFHTGVSFRPHESVLKIDRKFSGSRRAIIHQRRAKVAHKNGAIRLRLILDRFSAEVFVNDGEKVMSLAVDTPVTADRISFFADGAVRLNVKASHLTK